MARTVDQAREAIRRWFDAAVRAVEPERAVRQALLIDGRVLTLDGHRIEVPGRLIVVAVGKAALAMARAAQVVAGDLIDAGVVLTKDGHAGDATLERFEIAEASHPIPDERGAAATRAILEHVSDLGEEDVVLALISGGGSALLEATRPPVTLEDLATTTDLLLRAGAPIEALNGVRRPLSQVKAGGLLRAAAPATVATVILSDVLGNDPRVIASGPTVAGRPDPAAALEILERYGVSDAVPASVHQVLTDLSQADPGDEPPPGIVTIVGDNNAAVDAAAEAARADGYSVEVVWREQVGEAADLGRAWVTLCHDDEGDAEVLLGGGEATVTVKGDGIGGRNTEFALAAALELDALDIDNWVVASLATDGEDGPTGAAGAIADAGTVQRAADAGVDAKDALANNDSLRVFEAAGGVVKPGPTGTNVNDIYLAVRLRAE
jgi:glycerate 2-kinase